MPSLGDIFHNQDIVASVPYSNLAIQVKLACPIQEQEVGHYSACKYEVCDPGPLA
jgi:hypothetical protein